MNIHYRYIVFIPLLLATLPAIGISPVKQEKIKPGPESVEAEGPIENLIVLEDGLISGSVPSDEEHYQQLKALGVKTIISVDAIAPDQQLTNSYGIRPIHLPIGYDGINTDRMADLAYAISSAQRPIYIHCHHGKHRGPAALSAAAIATGDLDHESAKKFMIKAGTSEHYSGLWEAVESASLMDVIEARRLSKRVRIGKMKEVMANLDPIYELLWDIADNDFESLEEHPDASPISLAGQIHNMLRTLEGTRIVERKGAYFAQDLDRSIEAAAKLENAFKSGDPSTYKDALDSLEYSCVDCHTNHRN